MTALKETAFQFPHQTQFYKGKVRDVYTINDDLLVMVASDRISAFDVVLPSAIPYKGQVLNQIAAKFLAATQDIIPNWVVSVPDATVTIGKKCETFPVEMVIRGYLAGHAWREYAAGRRVVCGVALPEGLKENDLLPEPIITPTTKAHEGHDEDISREAIIATGLVSEADYIQLENYTRKLFARGTEMSLAKGLLLVDTKYEFGKIAHQIYLIDEIHTPDSSRYFYAEGYQERQIAGTEQKQLSKEFVRKWLIENGFQGKEGQAVPEMTPAKVKEISDRYIELYEKIIAEKFIPVDNSNIAQRIETNVLAALKKLS
jgi:phosphoribosylaminoimidazole-succinocarboxamide synthase